MSPHLALAGATGPNPGTPDGASWSPCRPHCCIPSRLGLRAAPEPGARFYRAAGPGLALCSECYWVLPPRTRGLLVSFTLKPIGGMNAIKVSPQPAHTRGCVMGKIRPHSHAGPWDTHTPGSWLGEGPATPEERHCQAVWPASPSIAPASRLCRLDKTVVCRGFLLNEVLILMQSPKGMGRGKMDQ